MAAAPSRCARGARPRPPGLPPPSAFGLVRPQPLSFAIGLRPWLSAPAPLGAPLWRPLVGLFALLSSGYSPARVRQVGAVPPVSLSPFGRVASILPPSAWVPFGFFSSHLNNWQGWLCTCRSGGVLRPLPCAQPTQPRVEVVAPRVSRLRATRLRAASGCYLTPQWGAMPPPACGWLALTRTGGTNIRSGPLRRGRCVLACAAAQSR